MPPVYNLAITMTGAAGNRSYDIPKASPPPQFLNMVNMTDNFIYLATSQAQGLDEAIYTFGPYATLSVPITAEIQFSFQIFWTATTDLNLVKKAQVSFTFESLGYNQSYADSFAYNSGSLNMSITGNPTVNANIQGVANVAIQGTPQVDITGQTIVANVSNAGFEADIINAKLGTNDLILLNIIDLDVNNFLPNEVRAIYWNNGIRTFMISEAGIYDGFAMFLCSRGGNSGSYSFPNLYIYLYGDVNGGIILPVYSYSVVKTLTDLNNTSGNGYMNYFPPMFFETLCFNAGQLFFKNNSAYTINNEHLTMYFFGIKSGISNPASVPVNMIYGQGSYDTPNYVDVTAAASQTQSLLVAGNYLTQFRLSVENISSSLTAGFVIKNGSNVIYSRLLAAKETAQLDFDMPSGVYNNGISISVGAGAGTTISKGFISTSAATPKSRAVSIV